jgi:hypothetical protein
MLARHLAESTEHCEGSNSPPATTQPGTYLYPDQTAYQMSANGSQQRVAL